MKKQLTILLFIFFTSMFVNSQYSFIKTATPCDKALLLKTPGEWMKPGQVYSPAVSKLQLLEIEKRLNTIHQWAQNVYPLPIAFDIISTYSIFDVNFASQIKIQSIQVGSRILSEILISMEFQLFYAATQSNFVIISVPLDRMK